MPRIDRSQKPYDLLVWGATGFTGRLVTRYLAQNAPADFAWAIGGRNEFKLRAIASEARSLNPSICRDADIIVGDADKAARCARVIISTAGPFYLYGEPLIQACIQHCCDYCDITGETLWVDAMIRKYGNPRTLLDCPTFALFMLLPGTNKAPKKMARFWCPCVDSTQFQPILGLSSWFQKHASDIRRVWPRSKLLWSRKEVSAEGRSPLGSLSRVLQEAIR